MYKIYNKPKCIKVVFVVAIILPLLTIGGFVYGLIIKDYVPSIVILVFGLSFISIFLFAVKKSGLNTFFVVIDEKGIMMQDSFFTWEKVCYTLKTVCGNLLLDDVCYIYISDTFPPDTTDTANGIMLTVGKLRKFMKYYRQRYINVVNYIPKKLNDVLKEHDDI